MYNWNFNIEKTNARKKALTEFYEHHGLNADNFFCKKYDKCLASQKGNIIKQYSGGTVGLSPFYDTSYNNINVRVLVIGKETGYMANQKFGTSPNFLVNSNNVLNCINWKNKNNHILGTLITLQRIFETNSEYVLASFALSNLLRCAFQEKDKQNNVSGVHDTTIMRTNCVSYLVEEIKILEPTLIITQGEWASGDGFVTMLNKELNTSSKSIMYNKKNGKYGLFDFNKFFLITCHHPAILGNWKVNLAPDSLWPMLEYLKEIGYLPKPDIRNTKDFDEIVKPVIDPILKTLISNDYLRKKSWDGSKQQSLF